MEFLGINTPLFAVYQIVNNYLPPALNFAIN